jgi:hypothetical protein
MLGEEAENRGDSLSERTGNPPIFGRLPFGGYSPESQVSKLKDKG